jgi:Cysteine-rich CPXCG
MSFVGWLNFPIGNNLTTKYEEVGRLKILFLHGWHSVVGGVKPTYLANSGHQIINPSLDNNHFDLAMHTAQVAFDLEHPNVVVGSSRGGALAMNLQHGTTPLVLLCPAWKKWGTIKKLQRNSLILHSRFDDVIPFSDSEELVLSSGLPSSTVIETGHDHRLADEQSLSAMMWACNILVSGDFLSLDEDFRENLPDPRLATASSHDEATYVCDACGETIVVPLDLSQGSNQSYLEDCPVCCRANIIHVHIDDEGDARIWSEPEQDYE